jgi:hypothetical protein
MPTKTSNSYFPCNHVQILKFCKHKSFLMSLLYYMILVYRIQEQLIPNGILITIVIVPHRLIHYLQIGLEIWKVCTFAF